MKRFLVLVLLVTFAGNFVFGQDAGTQQRLEELSGQIETILATQGQQEKRLAALDREISELRDKGNTPAVNTSASSDDLKNLAEKVQEVDKKRQEDRALILKEIEKLGKVAGSTPAPHHTAATPPPAAGGDAATVPAMPQKGYYYPVQAGDTLAAIAKAYRDQGVKVTTTQILKANPGLDPGKLYTGKKIFIPDANAK